MVFQLNNRYFSQIALAKNILNITCYDKRITSVEANNRILKFNVNVKREAVLTTIKYNLSENVIS